MAETKPTWIAAATGAGFASLLTQIVLARELLVVFLGHELTLGIIFGIWLVGAAFGSFLGRSLSRNIAQDKLALTGAATLALLAMLPLPMIFVARGLRLYFAAGVGEFLPIGAIFAGCAASLAPVCIPNGFLFPIMCHGASKQKTQAVARIYAADAFGSLIAGLFFTFVLAWRVSSIASALIVSAAACAAAACLLNRRPRLLAASAAVLCVFIAAWPGVLPPLEQFAANWRWRAFGIINPNSPEGAPSLVMERESRYQNIALLEAMGQAAIYGNGQVLFSFPDRLAAEFNIHQCMAQNPKARRVLLLGGNPVDDVRELLRYPLESLVHVELDGMTSALVRGLPTEARQPALQRMPRIM